MRVYGWQVSREETLGRRNFIMSAQGIALVKVSLTGGFIFDFLGICDKGVNLCASELASL